MSTPGELTEIRALLFKLVYEQGETRAAIGHLRDDIASRSRRVDDLEDAVEDLQGDRRERIGRTSAWSAIVAAVTSLAVGVGARNIPWPFGH